MGRGDHAKLPVNLPPVRGGAELWRRAKNAVNSIKFLQKSGRETWRDIIADGGEAWKLPPVLCVWTPFADANANGDAAQRFSCKTGAGMWIKRHVLLQSGRFIAVATGGRSSHSRSLNQRDLVDMRDVRQIVLASSAVQADVDGAPEVIFPWTLIFENGVSLQLAAQVPRDRLLWSSAVQKLSGASLRGDDGDWHGASSARRLGTDYASNDMGLAGDSDGPLQSHSVLTYLDTSQYTGGYVNGCWVGMGRLKMSAGDIYEGAFLHGERHGKGLMRYASKNLYEGEFEDGQRSGKGSYYYFPERSKGTARRRPFKVAGLSAPHLQLAWQFPRTLKAMDSHHYTLERYEGQWKGDVRHGNGVLTENAHADPIKFHVEYERGELMVKKRLAASEFLPRGLAYKEDEMLITANFPCEANTCVVYGEEPFFFSIDPPLPASLSLHPRTGAISGVAKTPFRETVFTITCHNEASRREGGEPATAALVISAQDDEVTSGWRRKEYTDGSLYTGRFEDGVWHGSGSLRLASGETYKGGWHHGTRSGQGDLVFGRARYAGEFLCNARSGFGSMLYENGDRYIGEWREDCRHGAGELVCRDGRRVYGEWQRDCYVGEVKETRDAAPLEGGPPEGGDETRAEQIRSPDGRELHGAGRMKLPRLVPPQGEVGMHAEESSDADARLDASLHEELDMERARSTMKIRVPKGKFGGETLQVPTATGCVMQVTIPDGLKPNDTFEMFIASCLRESRDDWLAALRPL